MSSMVSEWFGDRGGHSYFGSCSRWITSLEPPHGEAPAGCSSFSSQHRRAARQALREQPDRDLDDATQQRNATTKYLVGASGSSAGWGMGVPEGTVGSGEESPKGSQLKTVGVSA